MSDELNDVQKVMKSFDYLLSKVIELMDEAEKKEDWRTFEKYAQILKETRRLMS